MPAHGAARIFITKNKTKTKNSMIFSIIKLKYKKSFIKINKKQ